MTPRRPAAAFRSRVPSVSLGQALPWRLVLACLLAAVPFAEALAAEEGSAMPPMQGVLKPGASARHALDLHAGDYVVGELRAAAAPALWLDDADGRPLRRLLDAWQAGEFMFVAGHDGRHVLRLQGAADAKARYELHVTRVLPMAGQQPSTTPPPPRSPRLQALGEHLASGGDTAAFWAQVAREGAPLVETVDGVHLATFLWRGARRNVRLFAAPSGDIEDLQRLDGSDVWFATYEVPADTRMSYKLAPDVPVLPEGGRAARRAVLATVQRDPLNPRFWPADAPDDFARESILELPGAPPQRAVRPGTHPAGTISAHRLGSARLGNTRDIHLYRSPGYRAGDARNLLLVVFDGYTYQNAIPTPVILDNLVGEGALPPVLAVFVSNPDADARARELPCNPAFGDFLAQELLPWVQARAGTLPAASRTALAGASYGGLASACMALQYPRHFGNVLSQSGSFWWAPDAAPGQPGAAEPEWLARRYAEVPRQPIRFWLEAGRFETGRGQAGILESNRHLRDVLRARGYDVRHREFSGGHDWYHWRGTLADGLLALFAATPSASPMTPADASAPTSAKDY
ncbi:enterochelin esterase [Stenotrophomonas daejeonensis]|uniref:enterochelin esterase n=1 Tax=Stenotrophomonas daejeonensis TaxID=659018 RepID=UPI0009FA8793|nr:enterochelin esterase [Stenotrophomonas daejeonensis]